MVSRKWTFQLSFGFTLPIAAALGHDRVRLAEQGLGDDRGLLARQPGLDGRPQPRTAGADHHDVVAEPGDVAHQKNLGSEIAPLATSRMYRSVNSTQYSDTQAYCMCWVFSLDTWVHIQYRTGCLEKCLSLPPVTYRQKWQDSE